MRYTIINAINNDHLASFDDISSAVIYAKTQSTKNLVLRVLDEVEMLEVEF